MDGSSCAADGGYLCELPAGREYFIGFRKVLYLLPGGGFVDIFHVAFGGSSFVEELFDVSAGKALIASFLLGLLWGHIALDIVKKRFRWGDSLGLAIEAR